MGKTVSESLAHSATSHFGKMKKLLIPICFALTSMCSEFQLNAFSAELEYARTPQHSDIPGKSDSERWAWVSANLKGLFSVKRADLSDRLKLSVRGQKATNPLFLRITARAESEQAFRDSYFELRLRYDDDGALKSAEVVRVSDEYYPLKSYR